MGRQKSERWGRSIYSGWKEPEVGGGVFVQRGRARKRARPSPRLVWKRPSDWGEEKASNTTRK